MNEHSRQSLGPNLAFVALLITVAALLCVPGGSAESNDLDGFAKCLAEKNTTMYGSFLCPHCDDQKKLFGSSFRYVPYVECSMRGSRQMTFPCMAAQIRFTPTWIFANGERLTGVQPLKDLSEKTGCKLP
jgi:protein-disulfide isomerase